MEHIENIPALECASPTTIPCPEPQHEVWDSASEVVFWGTRATCIAYIAAAVAGRDVNDFTLTCNGYVVAQDECEDDDTILQTSTTVYINVGEGWVHELTHARQNVEHGHVIPAKVVISTYKHGDSARWRERAKNDSNLFVFECERV